jgi:hypothetical protein
MTNVGTLTVASNPFDVGAVPRAHVEDRSPSFDIDRARPPATDARHFWSIDQLPPLEEQMADGFAIYSDVATRYVKAFEVQKEHSIFGCTLQADTRGYLCPDWHWAIQCFPVVRRNKARTGDRKLDQGRSRSALTHEGWCSSDELNPSRASLQLVWSKSFSG